MRSNAWRSTRRSNGALWATSTRPRNRSASSGSTCSSGGAPSTIAWVMPVKRWIPRRSGALVRTSDDQRSWSSPPPTSTAPTSVISQASPARPFVSVSTTRNSAVAIGCSSRVKPRVIRPGPDGTNQPLHKGFRLATGTRGRIVRTVTAIAPDTKQLDEDTRLAWTVYRERLRGLTAEDYEHVEHEAWDELQSELRRVERRRKLLIPGNIA